MNFKWIFKSICNGLNLFNLVVFLTNSLHQVRLSLYFWKYFLTSSFIEHVCRTRWINDNAFCIVSQHFIRLESRRISMLECFAVPIVGCLLDYHFVQQKFIFDCKFWMFAHRPVQFLEFAIPSCLNFVNMFLKHYGKVKQLHEYDVQKKYATKKLWNFVSSKITLFIP